MVDHIGRFCTHVLSIRSHWDWQHKRSASQSDLWLRTTIMNVNSEKGSEARRGTSLAIQWLRLCASDAEAQYQGTKISRDTRCGQININWFFLKKSQTKSRWVFREVLQVFPTICFWEWMSNQCQINWSVRLISLTKGKISTKNAVITSNCLFFFPIFLGL